MTDAASQNDALEALKAFNTAITTTRLYPADAPQVPVLVEKAYQAIKQHLRKNGDLHFSIDNAYAITYHSKFFKGAQNARTHR